MGGINSWSGAGLVLVWGLCSVVGCGNSSSNDPASGSHAGAGGGASAAGGPSAQAGAASTTTGGANTGGSNTAGTAGNPAGAAGNSAGGGPGGLRLGDSQTEACIAYAVAVCLRSGECAGRVYTVESCLASAADCPDTTFSDGSTRTAANLKACAAEYASFSCAKLNARIYPDCVTAGTRAAGSACLYNSQCASLSCQKEGSSCGTCDKAVGLDADCSATGVVCEPGLSCDRNTNRCAAATPNRNDETFAEGKPCTREVGCNVGLYCASSGVCTKQPTLGMSCEEAAQCGDASYCAVSPTRICTAPPAAGQPCGKDTAGTFDCATGSVCSYTDLDLQKCVAQASPGQACLSVLGADLMPIDFSCAPGSFCDMTRNCVPLLGAGAHCQGSECQAGLTCACTDGTNDCLSKYCTTLGFANAPCGSAEASCRSGFTCTAGSCQPRPLQGLFTKSCGGK